MKPHQKIFIAAQPPYAYSKLKDYLGLLGEQYPEIKIKKVGETLSGLDIPLIKICKKEEVREAVIVLARTHPGETASSFSIETFIERIMEKKELRDRFDFYILPMVNPDGVFFGNHRTSAIGQDLNRNFKFGDLEGFPEI